MGRRGRRLGPQPGAERLPPAARARGGGAPRGRAPTSPAPPRGVAEVADGDHSRALSVFRRLLERERGAYWTFCVFTGERFLIAASPRRHASAPAGARGTSA